MGIDEFHKLVTFSVHLPGLATMPQLFHDSVVSSYVKLVASWGDVSSSDIEYNIRKADGAVVDFSVLFPPKGESHGGRF
jgi:hypothetical protein